MSSYSATMFIKNDMLTLAACGSSGNISIDGRLSFDNAKEIARELFKKEAAFKKQEYIGFAIEKTARFVKYKNPTVVDSKIKKEDVLFLM